MRERLIEDWLTKINERGFELPFCQILLAKGDRILRVGHSPYEDGKDILAVTRDGKISAYQLKSGDLSLTAFETYYPQIQALVEAAVSHPSIKDGSRHHPYFVTTGKISNPVLNRVKNLNANWRRRRFHPLTLMGQNELHTDFAKISENFWPLDPPDIREFLGLYLAQGKGDLDKKTLSTQLLKLLGSKDEKITKTDISRRISAANIFTSYTLKEFYTHKDYWSIFSAWVICASHCAWAAERYSLPDRGWRSSFQLAFDEALSALESLVEEVLSKDALRPRSPELDDFTRARNTVAFSAVAAFSLSSFRTKPGF